jgi:hypothetical protein
MYYRRRYEEAQPSHRMPTSTLCRATKNGFAIPGEMTMTLPPVSKLLMLIIGLAAFVALSVAPEAQMAHVAVVVVVGVPVSCFLIDRIHRFCFHGNPVRMTRRPRH